MRKGKLNIVIAPYSINGGMAVGKRLKNLAYYLEQDNDINIANFFIENEIPFVDYEWRRIDILSKKTNRLLGHIHLFVLLIKRLDKNKNILYYYGVPNIFNFWMFYLIRKLGYIVVLDIVEDYSTFTSYNGILNYINVKLIAKMFERLNWFSDGIIVISTYLENRISKIVHTKVPILKLPISFNKEDFMAEVEKDNLKIKFFYGGSFAYKDGVIDLINCFNTIFKEFKNIELILTGKIGSTKDLLILTDTLEKVPNTNIKYLGFISDEEYIYQINHCHVLCMPRRNIPFALAGFPFKIGEYMLTGNPVLASSINELTLIFDDTEILYYNSDDEFDLQTKMTQLIKDPLLRSSIGLKGKVKAMELFNAENHVKTLLRFLKEL